MNKLKSLKNKRGQSLQTFIWLFIIIILGVVFVTAIADEQSKMTDKNSVDNETFNLTSNGCYTAGGEVNESSPDCNLTVSNWYDDWRASEPQCYLSAVTVSDSTDTALTEDTDYVLHEDEGVIQMLNTSDTTSSSTGELVLTDYEYCPYGYNTDSSARSVASLITIFFALALLAYVIWKSNVLEAFGSFR